ncbi:tripartite tricarboxylate transporter substrate binding protein [Bordetella sp. BOR01]|uniref:Bug family tripartite tricarboxylate transporter substrate binding protein n=1 Tax=Bordetella sp. BOR01 TaxID=2854779 RepID=UPI001C4544AA|nr:tripartite tricarboxylate transporter substrate binding protein [Bordetella sp. BOR01]MBV7484789.1 tripartite tricarboxylate transporter substrate binding protein [Bordetella sp. BOR01]
MKNWTTLWGVVAAGCAILAAPLAQAQDYPSHSITLVVPFAAAGISDNQSRMLARKLADSLGQPVVVENRPGASGMIGAEAVAHARPDGYTLLYGTHGTQAANLALFDNVRIDPPKDLRAVHSLFRQSTVLVANAATPYRSLKDLVQAARQRPGAVNYASAGSGTQTHLAAARLQSAAGISLTHIPYKGAGPALADVLGGNVEIMFSYPESVDQHIQAGKLRALAVAGQSRLDAMPQVPTMAEAGYPDAALEGWSGVFVPAGTPDDVVARLAAAIRQATEAPDVVASMAAIGSFPMGLSDADFQRFVEQEVPRWKEVVVQSGARLE